jgi:hypothetical protein
MPELCFPADRIVGTLDWVGSYSDDRGPVLATGGITVPEIEINLEIQGLLGTEPTSEGVWTPIPDESPVDLGFLNDLPSNAIHSVSILSSRSVVEDSMSALRHLAPGLRRLYLGWTGLSDAALPAIAQLTGLTYLQTFGNNFSDDGVQELVALQMLVHLYLEEDTLGFSAFEFTSRLPHLVSLGLQDVPLSPDELERIRQRLPGVEVG